MSRSAHYFVLLAIVTFMAIAHIVYPHMFLASPKPIEGAAPKDPLMADGSNFPCHGAALPKEGGQIMDAGSSFPLRFDLGLNGSNTAVHGGGSCQVAITYDTDADMPQNPSNWHVIYSIEGGCPSSSAGNLLDASYCSSPGQAECVHTWEVPLPAGLRSGHATLSWTWFNALGEREMYQNCANVEIVGGTGEEVESLPAMYVANIGPPGVCTSSPEGTNVAFPDPGRYRTSMSATDGSNWPSATASCSIVASQLQDGHALDTTTDHAAVESPMPCSEKACRSSGDGLSPGDCKRRPLAATGASYMSLTNSSIVKIAPNSGSSATTSVNALWSAALSTICDASPTAMTSSACPSGLVSCSSKDLIVCIGKERFGLCDKGCAQIQLLAPCTTCSAVKILDT